LTTKSAKQNNALPDYAIHSINPAAAHSSRCAAPGSMRIILFPFDLLYPSLFKQRPGHSFQPGRESNCNPAISPCQPASGGPPARPASGLHRSPSEPPDPLPDQARIHPANTRSSLPELAIPDSSRPLRIRLNVGSNTAHSPPCPTARSLTP